MFEEIVETIFDELVVIRAMVAVTLILHFISSLYFYFKIKGFKDKRN